MTTVAANLAEMSADSMASDGFADFNVDKIHVVGPHIVGFCGTVVGATKFVNWLQSNKLKPPKRDPYEREEESFYALVLSEDGLRMFENSFTPYKIKEPYFAMGAGGQSAMTSMKLGKTPKESVEIACEITPSTTRLPVVTVRLADVLAAIPKKRKRK